jgi:hypothetical protein
VSENPWWQPTDDDLAQAQPLPKLIELATDYDADLPLWGDGGNIPWQDTGFSPALLDRLAAWQQDFDANYHWDSGWRSAEARDRWTSQGEELAADVRAELGNRAELTVRLWPLGNND